jgi:DDB1- and CUL4-associated factor 13
MRIINVIQYIEIRLWDLADRTTVWNVQGHKGIVKGVCCNSVGNVYLSCGLDKTVKVWNPEVSTEVR